MPTVTPGQEFMRPAPQERRAWSEGRKAFSGTAAQWLRAATSHRQSAAKAALEPGSATKVPSAQPAADRSVKALETAKSPEDAEAATGTEATEPVSRLPDRSSAASRVKSDEARLWAPVSRLPLTSSTARAARSPKRTGQAPDRSLSDRSSKVSSAIRLNASGMEPARELPLKSR